MDELLGRRDECAALDRLVADVLAGASRVLVLRGEAGVGKSALLGYLSDRVAGEAGRGGGWRVVSALGVESEMELAYSGLQQLCAPLLDHLDELPPPQRDALATVFGLSTGPAPDRFLVGLATLTLVAHAAEQQPRVAVAESADLQRGQAGQHAVPDAGARRTHQRDPLGQQAPGYEPEQLRGGAVQPLCVVDEAG